MSQRAHRALKASRRQRNTYEQAQAFNLLGLSKLERRKPDARRAEEHFRAALRVLDRYRALNPNELERAGLFESQILNNLGLALDRDGRADSAPFYLRSLKLKQRFGALQGIAVTSGNLCHFWARCGNKRAADQWQRRAVDLMQKYGFRFNEAYLWRELGEIALRRGDRVTALQHLRRANTLYKSVSQSAFGIELTARLIAKASASGPNGA